MNCSKINNLIFLLDEEMNTKEQRILWDHIEKCKNCYKQRKEWLESKKYTTRFFSEEKIDSPLTNNFEERIVAEIEKQLTRKRAKTRYANEKLNYVKYSLAAVLLALIGLFIFQEYQHGENRFTLHERIKTIQNKRQKAINNTKVTLQINENNKKVIVNTGQRILEMDCYHSFIQKLDSISISRSTFYLYQSICESDHITDYKEIVKQRMIHQNL